MMFNKSTLAMAVAVAISSPAFAALPSVEESYMIFESLGMSFDAGVIKSRGTGDIIVAGGKKYSLDNIIETKESLHKQFHNPYTTGMPSTNDALYYSKNNALIEIKNAKLTELDFELKNANTRRAGNKDPQDKTYQVPHEEFLTEGTKSTFLLNNVTAAQTIFETNGAHIEHDGSASAIEIKNSHLTSFTGHSVFLENNGGEIIVDGTGNAIDISNSTINGVIRNRSWSDNREPGLNGDRAVIISTKGSAISVAGGEWNGGIVNDSTIDGGKFGINIADDVTGNIVIDQRAGQLKGATALRMNKNTHANFTGGKITGNVENHGGTFYVEGNQKIAGDYMQTSGSTLAMGLHKQTSLTANNISLADGSKVLIDLSKGDLYVQNGNTVELLKGNVTANNIDYSVKSSLVTIAKAEVNAAGNLVLTFDRTSYEDGIGGDTGGNTGGDTGGNIGGDTGGNTGGDTGGNTGGDTGGNTNISSPSAHQVKNIENIAKVFDEISKLAHIPAINDILAKLDSAETTAELNAVAAQFLPDVSGASKAAALGATNQSNAQVSVRARSLAAGDALENSGLWVQGLVSKGDQDNRNGEAYDVKSHGFVLGSDTELNNGLVVGGAYSFINTESNTQNSNTEADYHMATVYAAQALGQVLLDGQAYYAWGDNDSRRNIGTTASYDSSLYGARVGAGYQLDLGNAARLIPTLSLEASRLSVDGYTESGLGALKVDSQDYNRLELGLSTELSKDYQFSSATVTPSVNLGAFHDFEGKVQSSTVSFAAAPAETFNVSGTKPEKTRYVAGVGLDIVSNEVLTVSAEYNYNWNTDGFDANSGALKFRWDF